MRKRSLLGMVVLGCLLLLLGGCISRLNLGMDALHNRMTQEAIDYCAQPYYRREALFVLLSGALEQHKIQFGGLICPGDEMVE